MKVEVYRNLHKKCYSVRYKGKVIKHVDQITLINPKFAVQPAGNAKVRQTGSKNVHAFIRGDWDESYRDFLEFNTPIFITYNPYKHTSFMNKLKNKPIYDASYVLLHKSGVVAWKLKDGK